MLAADIADGAVFRQAVDVLLGEIAGARQAVEGWIRRSYANQGDPGVLSARQALADRTFLEQYAPASFAVDD